MKEVVGKNIPLVANITRNVSYDGNKLRISAWCITRIKNSSERALDTDKVKLTFTPGDTREINFKWKYGFPLPFKCRLNKYEYSVSREELVRLDIQNKIQLEYADGTLGRILYSIIDIKSGKNKNEKIFSENGLSFYFRQNLNNTMYLTVREENFFDTDEGRALVEKAYAASKTADLGDIILMYEKECERYEESASVLYEKLIDMGYDNVYYILDKNGQAYNKVPEKYRKNIIDKHSYEHLLYFFKCKKLIGSETIQHAIQLRPANKKILDKAYSKNLSYVFLQHGVMYMVALDADLRHGFWKRGLDLYRVVVSSRKEADHFISLGGFSENELYITGLAKFDKSYLNPSADKIVIMPTWRRWEANLAKDRFNETKYYKMLERMVDAVPEELKDRIIILPHPLIQDGLKRSNTALASYICHSMTHDEVLRDCRLLITDYSSIAYDAFYRGSNVIFYWEEKDECMEHYGGSGLMLKEEEAFGAVCYSKEELAALIEKAYNAEQSEENIEKYRLLVEFHDNRNSERIIEKLKEDGII